jgi:hypothetical protein
MYGYVLLEFKYLIRHMAHVVYAGVRLYVVGARLAPYISSAHT